MQPVVLPANQPPDRFYRGGARITAFRAGRRTDSEVNDLYVPEDWVASTTRVRNDVAAGRTVLPNGTGLAEAIDRDPLRWLGPDHLQSFGVDTMLLVKLLDAGQRLPVHAHPDSTFAQLHLGAGHGKAEAWYMLTPGQVYLGLRRTMTSTELRKLVDEQDVEALLATMHKIEIQSHDCVFVPPGVLHAVGEGILLAEVQEPEDLSILLDWRDFAIDGTMVGHLGLGFDTALEAVETTARSQADLESLIVRADNLGHRAINADRNCLPADSARYFRLNQLNVSTEVPISAGFGVVIGIAGGTQLTAPDGWSTDVFTGSTVLIPFAAGALTLRGEGSVLLARPPIPGRSPTSSRAQ